MRKARKSNKSISIRYSLMKCTRKNVSTKKLHNIASTGYSTRETAFKNIRSNASFMNIKKGIHSSPSKYNWLYNSTIEPSIMDNNLCLSKWKSRISGFKSGTSFMKSSKKFRLEKSHEIINTKNTITDCQIYFPLKNKIIGDPNLELLKQRLPKFVIIPKEEYVKNFPVWNKGDG